MSAGRHPHLEISIPHSEGWLDRWKFAATAQLVVEGAGLFSVAVSVASLFGWIADWPGLTRWAALSPRMVPESALGTILAAIGLWMAQRQRRGALPAIGGVLLMLGLVNLILHQSAETLHTLASLTTAPVHLARGTAIAFVMLGAVFLLLSRAKTSLPALWATAVLGSGVIILGLITVLAEFAGTNSAPWWAGFLLQMALPTAASCCALGAGLVSLFFQQASSASNQFSITAAVMAVVGLLLLFAGVDAAVLAGSTSVVSTRAVASRASDQVRWMQALVESVRKAESEQRGYLLTGDRHYLKDFWRGRKEFDQAIQEKSVEDPALLRAIRLKLDELDSTVALEDQGRHEEAAALETTNGLHLMQEVDARQQEIAGNWQKERVVRRAESDRSIVSIQKTVLWSYGFAVLFSLGALMVIIAEIRRRTRVEADLREAEVRVHAELRRETVRAEEASRAKSSFLASMSHEIRTPMNAILGMADMLWETELSPLQRQYVEVFRRAGGNLLTLINDILDLSKIESGNLSLERVDFDLGELIEQLMEISSPKAEAKGVALTAHVEVGACMNVIGDPMRLQQVLINLLGNALKFTEHGRVSLQVQAQTTATHATLKFEISDTGIGIPADKLASIFEDFTQAESSVTRRFGGTGLGLSISQRIVRRMGGQLEVHSQLGQGSTFFFTVTLPIDMEQQTSQPAELVEISGKSVLIVDNNSTNRTILGGMCEAWGMVVKTCASGPEAIEAARLAGQSFDLALVDRMMPRMNGFETGIQLQALQPAIAIFIISSDCLPGDISRCLELGFCGQLLKPIRRAALLRRIVKELSRAGEIGTSEGAEGRVSTAEAGGMQTPIRILAAEDSDDNRFLLKAYCSGSRYDVTFVVDGEQAVQAYRCSPFDLIVMDIQMPVMDGLTATRTIRSLESESGRRHTPILAMTANALADDVIAARTAGCDAHLAKPISKAAFLSALAQWRAEPVSAPETAVRIEIAEGLEEGARRYLASRRKELTVIHKLLDGSDFPALARLSHNLKGTGTSFGFPDITDLGGAIEKASKDGNREDLSHQISQLSHYIESASKQLLPSE